MPVVNQRGVDRFPCVLKHIPQQEGQDAGGRRAASSVPSASARAACQPAGRKMVNPAIAPSTAICADSPDRTPGEKDEDATTATDS
jgi:hypothetical protein